MKIYELIKAYKSVPNVTLNLRDENDLVYYNNNILKFFFDQPIEMWYKELKRFTVVPLSDGSQTIIAKFKE